MTQRSSTIRSTRLPCWGRLSNQQGAVFLLAVYFTALTLLLLGGISFQRTNLEARSAQVFRDQQQAFWLSEAGLDKALAVLRTNNGTIKDDTDYPVSTLKGTATFRVKTDAQGNHVVTTTGVVSGTRQNVNATVAVEKYPQEGLWAGENIWIVTGQLTPPLPKVTGEFHITGGAVGALKLLGADLDGPVTLGPSGITPYSTSASLGPWGGYGEGDQANAIGYDTPPALGFYVPGVAGFPMSPDSPAGSGIQTRPGLPTQFSTLPQLAVMKPPERVDPRNDAVVNASTAASRCTSDWGPANNGYLFLTGNRQMTIKDGDPLDLSPPGDGKILMCLQALSLKNSSHLTFTSPTTIYLVGSKNRWVTTYQWGGMTFRIKRLHVAYGQDHDAVLQVLQGTQVLTNAAELVVPKWASSYDTMGQGKIIMRGGTFNGSVAAPYSWVEIGTTTSEGIGLNPVRVVGMWISLYLSHDLILKKDANAPSLSKSTGSASILNWTN